MSKTKNVKEWSDVFGSYRQLDLGIKLLQFLGANPEEFYRVQDLGLKTGVSALNVGSVLSCLIRAGFIEQRALTERDGFEFRIVSPMMDVYDVYVALYGELKPECFSEPLKEVLTSLIVMMSDTPVYLA